MLFIRAAVTPSLCFNFFLVAFQVKRHLKQWSINDSSLLFTLFSAEKVTSLGKDWHRPCLRCEKCKKTLSAGSHAEVGLGWKYLTIFLSR